MRAMCLCVKGVQVWNSLSDDFKIVNTVAAFKRKCKNLLFKNTSRCGPSLLSVLYVKMLAYVILYI